MSLLFTLHGRTSTLSIDFDNPIFLDPNAEYGLALLGFYSYNSIPNISAENGDNKFYYQTGSFGSPKVISIPTGSYEIKNIEAFIQKSLGDDAGSISIKANKNTLQCEIYSDSCVIDFLTPGSIGRFWRFSERLLDKGHWHISDLPVNILQVRTIHIDCNITAGAYYVNRPTHTIYEFAVGVDPGYAIDETPKNLLYLPVTKHEINNITVNILDQNFQPVNFRGEEIIIRLEVKRLT